jgi:hypothetical protein
MVSISGDLPIFSFFFKKNSMLFLKMISILGDLPICNNLAFQAQNNSNLFLYLTHTMSVISELVPSHHQDTIHTSTTINISFKSESYINT